MNIAVTLHILGGMLVYLAGTLLVPLVVSLLYADGVATAFLLSIAICVATGLVLLKTCKNNGELSVREGFAIVTFGWACFSLFGALPFYLSDYIPTFVDAFFETMSGFTTTGATILTDIEALPKSLLLWRALSHWLGGMGIIVLSLAILPMLGVGGMQLFKAEVPGPTADKLSPRIQDTAKLLWGVYVLLTLAETIWLMFGGMDLFDAICHSFATLATGGFSTKNASVAAFDSAYIDTIIIIFMFILAFIFYSLKYNHNVVLNEYYFFTMT